MITCLKEDDVKIRTRANEFTAHIVLVPQYIVFISLYCTVLILYLYCCCSELYCIFTVLPVPSTQNKTE